LTFFIERIAAYTEIATLDLQGIKATDSHRADKKSVSKRDRATFQGDEVSFLKSFFLTMFCFYKFFIIFSMY
jgi:hypothetical protein